MIQFKVLDGDFGKGSGLLIGGEISLPKQAGWGSEKISIFKLTSVEMATQENVKRVAGTLGWGAVGGLLLGPAGLLAGLLLGGRSTEVGFIGQFADGRGFLATANNDTFLKLRAAALSCKRAANQPQIGKSNAPDQTILVPKPQTSDPIELAEWEMTQAGWSLEKGKKAVGQRHTTFLANRAGFSCAIGCTPVSITEYEIDLVQNNLRKLGGNEIPLVVGINVPQRLARNAKQMGLYVTTFDELTTALEKLSATPAF
jgi:hypothetical protein